MKEVERIGGESRTRGYIEHVVRLPLHRRPVLFSSFTGRAIQPDVLEAQWVCRQAWGPWVLESVWVEGAVLGPLEAPPGLRDGLLFGTELPGVECSLERAPGWVRRVARQTQGMNQCPLAGVPG